MFPWEHITWMGFVTVITECRYEGTYLYREGAFCVSLKNRPRRVFTFNYFMEVSGRCITYFQRAQLWNIWENTVKKPAFFRNAGFFREKRDVFAKIAALNAAFFDQTLRFFLPGLPLTVRIQFLMTFSTVLKRAGKKVDNFFLVSSKTQRGAVSSLF